MAVTKDPRLGNAANTTAAAPNLHLPADKEPIRQDLVKLLGMESLNIPVAAICVYHSFVETALRALEGSGIKVAAVSTGFPAGLSPLDERVAEIRRSVEAGAHEIDVVITRA